MKRELEQRLAGDDLSLRAVRAVLVSVDGDVVLSYYRNRRPSDYAHVWSVTTKCDEHPGRNRDRRRPVELGLNARRAPSGTC